MSRYEYDSRSRRWRYEQPRPAIPYQEIVYTDEGILNFTINLWTFMPEGRQRVAFLDGHEITDEELEMRLAAHRQSA